MVTLRPCYDMHNLTHVLTCTCCRWLGRWMKFQDVASLWPYLYRSRPRTTLTNLLPDGNVSAKALHKVVENGCHHKCWRYHHMLPASVAHEVSEIVFGMMICITIVYSSYQYCKYKSAKLTVLYLLLYCDFLKKVTELELATCSQLRVLDNFLGWV